MPKKYQSTALNKNITNALIILETWADNPWRRYSLLLIIFFGAFVFGSSVGMINAVLELMDLIGAFFTVLLLEFMVRLRQAWNRKNSSSILLQIIDSARIGLLYGLFMEGFKLL
ncbi:DUF565 domain-containing protein [Prochlorococcus marinus]|uniref:DUF565 domain-containing protein n=1 Tax=Prochlorococcus marinus (strain MIT 9211) TaxID=93059 RepID=A9BDJ9_PROM4|nr:DUF565 domain-containing protein [Prochlorococcus marinus]ABX08185.1 conserved hypothetical protein [Prochlorococcus marinus str. MIT 9211]